MFLVNLVCISLNRGSFEVTSTVPFRPQKYMKKKNINNVKPLRITTVTLTCNSLEG